MKVLYLYSHAFTWRHDWKNYHFIFRKLSADRFDDRYEVLKNKSNGLSGYIVSRDEAEKIALDKM